MNKINYVKLADVCREDFLSILNSSKIREHLIDHDLFTLDSLSNWIEVKIEVDNMPGCIVRGITVDQQLAGWCGIQFEGGQYEAAVIIDDQFWGLGKQVFQEILVWAKELGHEEIVIHFLKSRPVYKFLSQIAKSVNEIELYDNQFTQYRLEVSNNENG